MPNKKKLPVDVNIRISPEARLRLKVKAAQLGISIKELIDRLSK